MRGIAESVLFAHSASAQSTLHYKILRRPSMYSEVPHRSDTWIPIEDEAKVLASSPDFLLVLPWHFRDFFVRNPALVGRRLVFPLPQLEVVTPESR